MSKLGSNIISLYKSLAIGVRPQYIECHSDPWANLLLNDMRIGFILEASQSLVWVSCIANGVLNSISICCGLAAFVLVFGWVHVCKANISFGGSGFLPQTDWGGKLWRFAQGGEYLGLLGNQC